MQLKAIKLFIVFFYSISSFAQISPIHTATLPNSLNEVSGMGLFNDTLYMHNDGGNPAEIYGIDSLGKLISTHTFSNTSNTDWEAFQISKQGDFLVADIGNNSNNRTDLRFYLARHFNPKTATPISADTIGFTYITQSSFPPSNAERHFDAEGFIVVKDSIFTKNRSNPYNGYSYVHYLPLAAGNYTTQIIDSIYTGSGPKEFDWITDATWDNNTLWLLSHGFALRFDSFREKRFTSPKKIIFDNFSQKEACAYKKPYLWVADEKHPTFGGGKLYQYLVDSPAPTSISIIREDLQEWMKTTQSEFIFNFPHKTQVNCFDLAGKLVASFRIGSGKQVLAFDKIPIRTSVLQTEIDGLLYSSKFIKP